MLRSIDVSERIPNLAAVDPWNPRLFPQQTSWWMDTIRPNMRSEYSMTHTRHTHLFLTSCSPASPYFPTLSGSLCHARTIKAVKYPYKQKPEGSSSSRWPFHGERNVPSHGIRWTMIDRLGKNLGRMMINHGMEWSTSVHGCCERQGHLTLMAPQSSCRKS